ncbi:MAG: hypothetical protein WA941_07140 [Nitrososphaeraceae archaeon]
MQQQKQKQKNRKRDIKVIEITSKNKYEKLKRENADLKLLHKVMKIQDRNTKAFVYRYLKPKYRPRLSKDEENELWSPDGHSYSTIDAETLEPTNVLRCVSPYEKHEKPLDDNIKLRLMRLSEKIAGKPFPFMIGDTITDNTDSPNYSLYV